MFGPARLPVLATKIVEGAIDLEIALVIGFFRRTESTSLQKGVLSLVPAVHRARTRELSGKIISTLRSWLFGNSSLWQYLALPA